MANLDYACDFYACTAKCEHGGRCRQKANPSDPDWLCGTHAHIRDNGGNVEKVGLADMTLIRFKLGPDASYWAGKWPIKFLSAGIPHIAPEQTPAQIAEEIRQRGEKTGRKVEGVYGQGRLDDGCAIFGSKGLTNMGLADLVTELVDHYGGIAAIQLIEGKNGNPILELVFSLHMPAMEVPQAAMEVVNNYLTSAWFGWVMPWHNPADPVKGVVMTLNADRRQNDGKCRSLLLNGGKLAISE